MLQRNARTQRNAQTSMPNRPPMHCTGKQLQDAIYIYDTSDRSKQKLPVDVEISFFLTSKMTFGYLMLITIKYGQYNNRRVKTHESDYNTKDFFCSIRSQHSHKGLEMVWRDSFPRGSFTFTKNFRHYDFCPVYFVLPRLTAPGSPRMGHLQPRHHSKARLLSRQQ